MKMLCLYLKILAVFCGFFVSIYHFHRKKKPWCNCITDSCKSCVCKEAIYLLQKQIPRQQLKISVSIFHEMCKFPNKNLSLLKEGTAMNY